MNKLRLLVSFLFFIFCINELHAQNWCDWSTALSRPDYDARVAIDGQDNFITIGSDNRITKYSRNGAMLWQKKYGSAYNPNRSIVTTDAAGNIYAIGPVLDSGFHTANYSGNPLFNPGSTITSRVYHNIAKLDPDGNILWSLYFNQTLSAVHVTEEGEVYIAGKQLQQMSNHEFDSVILGTMALYSPAIFNYLVMGKIDKNGVPQWLKTFKRTNGTYGVYDVAPDASTIITDRYNHVYLSGGFSTGTLSLDSVQLATYVYTDFTAQLNAGTGRVAWAKLIQYGDTVIYPSSGTNSPLASGKLQFVALNGTGADGVVMTGSLKRRYNVMFNGASYRPSGNYICSYDTSGNEKWLKFYTLGIEGLTGFLRRGNSYYANAAMGQNGNLDTLAVMDASFNITEKISTPGMTDFNLNTGNETIGGILYGGIVPPYGYHVCKLLLHGNKVSGYIFRDINNNGIKDSTEEGLANVLVGSDQHRFINISGKNGYYECYVDSGSHIMQPLSSIKYHVQSPAAGYSVNFAGLGATATGKDFAFSPTPGINDLQVVLTPHGAARPGFVVSYSITVMNNGTSTAAGIAGIRLPTMVTYEPGSNSSVPLFSSPDSVAFQFSNLQPWQQQRFNFNCRLSSSLWIGTDIKFYTAVTPVVNDSFPADNFDTLVQRVRGSFDPNDKMVFPDGDINIAQKDKPLSYVIRFQNTGNDTAFNVQVIDTISSKLDIATLEIVSSSHPVNISIEKNKVLHFYFDNINLPDSVNNEALSHGFIRFKVKPATSVTIGDTIFNGSSIYFDYNKPVMTNTTSTKYMAIVLPVILRSFTAEKNNAAVLLDFSTETENNLHHFEIERSTDGSTFSRIGKLAARGYSALYDFTDALPVSGMNFYRIKLVFADGAILYSSVQAIQFGSPVKGLNLFPNPVQETLLFTTGIAGRSTYKIFNAAGQLHLAGATGLIQNNSIVSVDVSMLQPGMYYLRVINAGGISTKKFFVSK